MEIKEVRNITKISELKVGEVFLYNDDLHTKVYPKTVTKVRSHELILEV